MLDYPSGSEDDDSDFVVEEPHETQENDSNVIDSDMVLSSSDSDESSLSGNTFKRITVAIVTDYSSFTRMPSTLPTYLSGKRLR